MSVLVVTGGHPFEREPFLRMLDDVVDGDWRHLEQPAAAEQLADAAGVADVVLFYDMPGIEFTRDDPPARFSDPSPAVVDALESLVARGVPMVFLHHAIAGWPTWDGYARMIGGRFHYRAADFDGVSYPASGYRHGVAHDVEVVAPDHPICAGLDSAFTITDELYLFPVREHDVTPLLRSRARFEADEFFSADLAIRGERDSRRGWTHPAGSPLVAWTRQERGSSIVYIQFGDGPATYADPNFRRLLANTLRWATARSAAGENRPTAP